MAPDHPAAGYERLLGELEEHTDRIALLSTSPVWPPEQRAAGPDPKQINAMRQRYNEAIRGLAERRGHGYIDVFGPLREAQARTDRRLTANGVNLNERGYQVLGRVLLGTLGDGSIDPLRTTAVERRPAYKKLRQLVRQKNELFFRRWRPQNTTYLYFFRKHEQGQNAKEIPQFDPLIAEREKQIRELCEKLGG